MYDLFMRYLIILLTSIYSFNLNAEINNKEFWTQSYNTCHQTYNDPRVQSQVSKQAHSNYCKCIVNKTFENFSYNELKMIENQMTFKSENERIKIIQLNKKAEQIANYCSINYLK